MELRRALGTISQVSIEFIFKKRDKGDYLPQTPPENAIKTLNALVLFSVLSSDLTPFRMPAITASIKISPAEHTAKETLEMRFLWSDSKEACSSELNTFVNTK